MGLDVTVFSTNYVSVVINIIVRNAVKLLVNIKSQTGLMSGTYNGIRSCP